MALEIKTGGGVFRTESFIQNTIITSGQTGSLLTIGTAGKITELTYLGTAVNTEQTGISVEVDSLEVIPATTLADTTPVDPNSLTIAQGFTSANMAGAPGMPKAIIGEFITIIKDAGNTAIDISVSYVTGVVK
jgi:hypothetical protein